MKICSRCVLVMGTGSQYRNCPLAITNFKTAGISVDSPSGFLPIAVVGMGTDVGSACQVWVSIQE